VNLKCAPVAFEDPFTPRSAIICHGHKLVDKNAHPEYRFVAGPTCTVPENDEATRNSAQAFLA
jgi:hypothetical protein